jgi:hypothetical protein
VIALLNKVLDWLVGNRSCSCGVPATAEQPVCSLCRGGQ